jgi:hypothetical protein
MRALVRPTTNAVKFKAKTNFSRWMDLSQTNAVFFNIRSFREIKISKISHQLSIEPSQICFSVRGRRNLAGMNILHQLNACFLFTNIFHNLTGNYPLR